LQMSAHGVRHDEPGAVAAASVPSGLAHGRARLFRARKASWCGAPTRGVRTERSRSRRLKVLRIRRGAARVHARTAYNAGVVPLVNDAARLGAGVPRSARGSRGALAFGRKRRRHARRGGSKWVPRREARVLAGGRAMLGTPAGDAKRGCSSLTIGFAGPESTHPRAGSQKGHHGELGPGRSAFDQAGR